MKIKLTNSRFKNRLLIMIMRTFIFLFCSVVFASIPNNIIAQNSKVKIEEDKVLTVDEVFDLIMTQTDYKFFYEEGTFKGFPRVHVKKGTLKTNKLLKKSLSHGDFDITLTKDNAIIIKEKPKKIIAKSQELKITGTVSDSNGTPLPGASILEKGTTNGTQSDFDGNYSIKVSNDAILVFSFVGYTTQEIAVNGKTTINVALVESAEVMDEIVVTALGIKRQKKEIGYATQTVKGASIVESSSPDVITALSGQIAGAEISVPDGVDGSSSRIIIRGNNSITGDNQPMIIIDGVIQSNDFANRSDFAGYTDWGTALNNVNSFDIESLDVLKGPAAAALYGARGSNGVILITTKKGKRAKGIGVNYSTRIRTIKASRYRDVQNVFGSGGPILANDGEPTLPTNGAGEFVLPGVWGTSTPQHSGGGGLGGRATWSDFSWYASGMSWGPKMEGQIVRWWDGELRPFDPQPNNIKEYFRTGTNIEHNVSFSSAGDFGSVRVSLTNLDHESVVPNSNYGQKTFNLGSSLNISEKLTANVSITYFDYNRKNSPTLGDADNSFGKAQLYYYPRNYKVLDKHRYENPDGSRDNLDGYANNYWGNSQYLWWNTYHNNTFLNRKKLLGSLSLNYEVTPWFNLSGTFGMESTNQMFTNKYDPIDSFGLQRTFYKRDVSNRSVANTDFMGTFSKEDLLPNFGASLSLGGATFARSDYSINGARGSADPNTYTALAYPYQFSFANIKDAKADNTLGEGFYDKKINSLYAFLNLSYKDYLFLQITGRNDWSSTLPSNNNSYFYPSANLSFVMSDAFDLSSVDWLSFAKLKLAYAQTALDTDPYKTGSIFTTGGFAGNPTVSLPDEIPPVNLKPQIADSYDVGLSLGLFDNRLNLDFAYYHISSYDQILSSPVPVSSGAGKYVFNTGELENKGVELVINANIVQKPDFSWNATLNLGKNKNFVVALDDNAEYLELANQWGPYGPSVRVKPGEQYGTIYGFDYLRNSNGEKLVSDDGHHYLTTAEKVPLGNATPDFVGGLNNNFKYKNFSLGINIDTKWGADVFAGTYAVSIYNGQSPITLPERLGNGLPYTSSDGIVRNIGVVLDGVHADGSENTTVVHPIWKYVGNFGSAWGDKTSLVNGEYVANKFLHRETVFDNSWIKLRQVNLSYSFPEKWLKKLGFIEDLNLSVVGRDLFYIYQNMPDNINPEGLTNVGNGQGLEWGSLPGFTSVTFGLNASF